MANLIIQENGVARTRPAVTGEEITIKTPCSCSDVTGVQINGVAFPFYDASGNSLADMTGLFAKDSLIRVLIDADKMRAYILNADTNAYLESMFKKVGNPHNFVDNSYFPRPVNQKRQTSYKGAVEGIDKWECTSNNWMVTVEDGCIKVSDNPDSSSTSTAMVRQTITVPHGLRGKTVTLAARLKGSDVRLNINNTATGPYAGQDDWYVKVITETVPADAETIFVALQCRNMVTWYCEWVALYEGEYTVDTLPEYKPKEYNVELLNCGGINADYVNAFVNGGRIIDIDSLDEDGIHKTGTESTGTFPSAVNGVNTGVILHKTWDENYKEQIFMSFATHEMHRRYMSSGVWKEWKQLAATFKTTATIPANWTKRTDGGIGYSQTFNIAGIKKSDDPIIALAMTDSQVTNQSLMEAWNLITHVTTYDGTVILYCYEEAPTVSIPVLIQCIR